MDRTNLEALEVQQGEVESLSAPLTQLADLELAFVGGGIGDTVL